MSGAIIKAKLDVKGQMGLRTQHVRGQAASAKACAERAWTAKYAFGQHTRSSDVGRGMPSSPLGTHGRTASAWHAIFAFLQHTRSNDVGRGMPSSPFDSIDGRPSSGVACHHSPWTAQTVGRRRTCLHTTVGRGLPASVVA
eukprot:685123_1